MMTSSEKVQAVNVPFYLVFLTSIGEKTHVCQVSEYSKLYPLCLILGALLYNTQHFCSFQHSVMVYSADPKCIDKLNFK